MTAVPNANATGQPIRHGSLDYGQVVRRLNRVIPGIMPKLKDIAAAFGISPATLWRYRKNGLVKASGGVGQKPWVSHEDLADAIMAGYLPLPALPRANDETDESTPPAG